MYLMIYTFKREAFLSKEKPYNIKEISEFRRGIIDYKLFWYFSNWW